MRGAFDDTRELTLMKPPRKELTPEERAQCKASVTSKCGKFDGYAIMEGKRRKYVGRRDTREEALAITQHYIATGELPSRPVRSRYRPPRKHCIREVNNSNGSKSYICQARDSSGGPGTKCTVRYVGTFKTREFAEAAGKHFEKTGRTDYMVGRTAKPKGRPFGSKNKRPAQPWKTPTPKIAVHRPVAASITPASVDDRARRPGESVGGWAKRLAVMKGLAA